MPTYHDVSSMQKQHERSPLITRDDARFANAATGRGMHCIANFLLLFSFNITFEQRMLFLVLNFLFVPRWFNIILFLRNELFFFSFLNFLLISVLREWVRCNLY